MTALPRLSKVKFPGASDWLSLYLENAGTSVLRRGTVRVKQTSTDGTVRSIDFFNNTELEPGESTRLVNSISNAKIIRITCYEESQDGIVFPLEYVYERRLFGWKLRG